MTEWAPKAFPGRVPRWLAFGTIAFSLGVGGYYLREDGGFLPPAKRAMLPLVKAVGERRLLEPRLTGGFRFGPLIVAQRGETAQLPRRPDGSQPADRYAKEWDLLATAAQIKARSDADPTEANRRVLFSAQLLLGDADRAIEGFSELVGENRTADHLSDLAAAHLARGLESDLGEDLAHSLELSTEALAMEGRHEEARFNQAIALDALGLRHRAIDRWTELTNVDNYPGDWAHVARAKLAQGASRNPLRQSTINLEALAAARAGDSEALRRLLAASVDGLANAFETEILSHLEDDEASATLVAEEYFRATGDDGFLRGINQARSNPEALEGLRLFALGRKQYDRSEWALMDQTFRRARESLAAARSPQLSAVDLHLGISALESGRTAEARSRVDLVLSARGASLRTRGRALLLAGILDDSRGNWTAASARRATAKEAFRRIGDESSVAYLDQQEASMMSRLGRTRASWNSRLRALRRIDLFPDPSRQVGILNVVGSDCRRAGWAYAAAEFHQEALRRAEQSERPEDRAQTHLDLAAVLSPLDPARADEHAVEADREIGQILDPMMKQIMEGQSHRLIAERDVGTAAEQTEKTTKGIAWAELRGVPAIVAPLLLKRARLRAQDGDLAGAEQDSREVLKRLSISEAEALAGSALLHLASAYDNLIDIATRRGQPPREIAALVSARLDTEHGRRPSPLGARRWNEAVSGAALLVAFLPSGNHLLRLAVGLGQARVDHVAMDRDRLAALVRRSVTRLQTEGSLVDAGALMTLLFQGLEDLAHSSGRVRVVAAGVLVNFPFSFVGHRALPHWNDGVLFEAATGFHPVESSPHSRSPNITLVVAFSARGLELPPLPGALIEAERIGALYGSNATLLTGPRATPQALEEELRTASVLHIAAHTLSGSEAALGSSILLAPADDGVERVTALRVSSMRLEHLNLAVLAGCDTARPADPARGTRLSLASAFVEAGARQVLASFWPLSDGATAGLMDEFHQRLNAGQDAGSALREVQRNAQGSDRMRDAAALTLIAGKPH